MDTPVKNPFGEDCAGFDVWMGTSTSTGKAVGVEPPEKRMNFLLYVGIVEGLLEGEVEVSL